MSQSERILKAIELGFSYGTIDGAHHKTWVIDQMLRILTDDSYEQYKQEHLREDANDWDVGIAP